MVGLPTALQVKMNFTFLWAKRKLQQFGCFDSQQGGGALIQMVGFTKAMKWLV